MSLKMRKVRRLRVAQQASDAADKTDEIASLDRVSRHLLPERPDDLAFEIKAQLGLSECE